MCRPHQPRPQSKQQHQPTPQQQQQWPIPPATRLRTVLPPFLPPLASTPASEGITVRVLASTVMRRPPLRAGGEEGHRSKEAPDARFPAPRPTSAARSLRVATSSHSHQAGASLGGGGERHPASAAAESASMPNEAMFVRPPPRPSSGASQRSLSHNPPTSESMANEAIFVGSAPTPPPTPALPLVSATLQHDVYITATAAASPPPTVGMGQAMCHDDGGIDGAAGERETEPAPEGPSDADDEL